MSTEPATYVRHPLGLPPGSVRSILAVMTTAIFVLLLLLPASKMVEIPLFLYFLMSLLLVFVVSHGKTIGVEGEPHPFGMPKGSIRFLIIAAVIATIGWRFWSDHDLLLKRLTPSQDQLRQWPWLFLALFGGFLAGRLLRMGPCAHPANVPGHPRVGVADLHDRLGGRSVARRVRPADFAPRVGLERSRKYADDSDRALLRGMVLGSGEP